MKNITKGIKQLLDPSLCLDISTYNHFLQLLTSNSVTKSSSPKYHCCVFFIPYNPKTKEIFIVYHKKAKQWIVPGGHIEENESLEDAAKREAAEELHWDIQRIGEPFLFSIMNISNKGQTCKAHYDIWFCISTEEELDVNMVEFNKTKWVSFDEAYTIIIHPTYLQALKRLQKRLM